MQGFFAERLEMENLKDRQENREVELKYQLKKENILQKNKKSLHKFQNMTEH